MVSCVARLQVARAREGYSSSFSLDAGSGGRSRDVVTAGLGVLTQMWAEWHSNRGTRAHRICVLILRLMGLSIVPRAC
jgi:hypothetical protein